MLMKADVRAAVYQTAEDVLADEIGAERVIPCLKRGRPGVAQVLISGIVWGKDRREHGQDYQHGNDDNRYPGKPEFPGFGERRR